MKHVDNKHYGSYNTYSAFMILVSLTFLAAEATPSSRIPGTVMPSELTAFHNHAARPNDLWRAFIFAGKSVPHKQYGARQKSCVAILKYRPLAIPLAAPRSGIPRAPAGWL